MACFQQFLEALEGFHVSLAQSTMLFAIFSNRQSIVKYKGDFIYILFLVTTLKALTRDVSLLFQVIFPKSTGFPYILTVVYT